MTKAARRPSRCTAAAAVAVAVALAGGVSACGDSADPLSAPVPTTSAPAPAGTTATASEPDATTPPAGGPTPAPVPPLPPQPTTAAPVSSVALGAEFTLAPGQSTDIDDGRLVVSFRTVTSDSRCPTDPGVACVWAGDAVVEVAVALGPTEAGGAPGGATTAELHTHPQYSSTAALGRYVVTLVSVAPDAPVDVATSYRATFRVSTS